MVLQPERTVLAVAMWDFSWLERKIAHGEYGDWAVVLDGLVERGYDIVRIDPYPHFISSNPGAEYELVPVWDQHDWGTPDSIRVTPLPALIEFISMARDRGIRVSLSSWFREDKQSIRSRLSSPESFAAAWIDTLRHIEAEGLMDSIYFVDLCNEWPHELWTPFLPGPSDGTYRTRTHADHQRWTNTALSLVRTAFPHLPLCFSFADQYDSWRHQDVSQFDLLEPHIWMTSSNAPSFYETLGYDIEAANFDPRGYEVLTGAQSLYVRNRALWDRQLIELIGEMATWSRSTGLPLVTTESWALVLWKDKPGLEWEWIKELCELGVKAALATGRWAALSTSNFCGPQFRGMWDDVEWHRSLTNAIHESSYQQ